MQFCVKPLISATLESLQIAECNLSKIYLNSNELTRDLKEQERNMKVTTNQTYLCSNYIICNYDYTLFYDYIYQPKALADLTAASSSA